MRGGNVGIPYPNGLVGNAWTLSSNGWPGVDGIPGNRNYLEPNLYDKGDPQTAMIATGANPPFSVGGGRVKRHRHTRQRGGDVTRLMPQDLVNLGRQVQFGVGSTYNALNGYPAPVNPQPWADQLPNTTGLSTIRAAAI
jgi:hypothetical protein